MIKILTWLFSYYIYCFIYIHYKHKAFYSSVHICEPQVIITGKQQNRDTSMELFQIHVKQQLHVTRWCKMQNVQRVKNVLQSAVGTTKLESAYSLSKKLCSLFLKGKRKCSRVIRYKWTAICNYTIKVKGGVVNFLWCSSRNIGWWICHLRDWTRQEEGPLPWKQIEVQL